VLDGLPAGAYSRYWALVENGIYYLNTRTADRQSVEFFSFSTRKIRRLFELPESAGPDWSPSFSVSPDQRTLLTVFVGQYESDIMLVDNFQSSPASERR
jgi:hypothetical protein